MALQRLPKTTRDIRQRDINAAVGGIRFDQGIVAAGWSFRPSIGLVARDVNRLGLDIRSFKEPLSRSIKQVMIPSIRQNFKAGGRPDWEALSEATIKLRGEAWPILDRTGRLRKGATRFNIWTITETAATVKSLPQSIWYGAIHQEGIGGFGHYVSTAKAQLGVGARPADITKRAFELLDAAKGPGQHRKVAIPARPFIMYQDEDIDAIQEVFADWLAERARKVGRFV